MKGAVEAVGKDAGQGRGVAVRTPYKSVSKTGWPIRNRSPFGQASGEPGERGMIARRCRFNVGCHLDIFPLPRGTSRPGRSIRRRRSRFIMIRCPSIA